MRARTTLAASAIVAVTLLAGSVALLLTLERSLTRADDDISVTVAGDLALRAARGSLPARLSTVRDDVVAQVVDDRGRVLGASSGLGDAGPISTYVAPAGPPVRRTLRGVPDDTETESYRVWALTAPVPGGSVRVYVGSSLEAVSEQVAFLRHALLIGVPVVIVLLALTMRVMVGRALRPVEDVRAEVASISDRDLHRRVPVPGTGDEVSRLAETMNAMLVRLDRSSRRQREFVADASHELQSPLAAFRTQLEIALRHPDPAGWPTLARGLLADSDRMERLVRDLLFLARADGAPDSGAGTAVDLDLVVLEEVARLPPRDDLDIDTTAVSAAPVTGHRDELGRMVRNVLENAADHARSRVVVQVTGPGPGARTNISDDGAGIPGEFRERVFDRFVQVENARPRHPGGTGLGLAIARAIAQRHGGSIDLEPAGPGPDPGTRAVIVIGGGPS